MTFAQSAMDLHEAAVTPNLTPSVTSRVDPLAGFDDSPEATTEALSTFEAIPENIYIGNATARAAAEESMGCQCKFDPDQDDPAMACGDKSDCINRILYIECKRNDCQLGGYCQNRRFQKKEYARVKVVKTQLKGYGLVAEQDLERGQFVMEYIGEVVSKSQFLKRTAIYEQENCEHHYFMSLKNDEVIDATRKGCIARFVNHSCAPNCEVQKWVVGSQFRMGIFTTRPIPKDTEITFDYKFVRYGAEPQRCFCGEPCCKGYIGVAKEAYDRDPVTGDVSLEEEMESQVVSSRQKAKVHEDDDEYVDPSQTHPVQSSRGLNSAEDVIKFVKVMMEASGKPNLASKLLTKLQDTEEVAYLNKFIRMHGVPLLKSMLVEYEHDPRISRDVLRVFALLPITKRNTIDDHRLPEQLERIKNGSDPLLVELCDELLDKWKHLETVYRIPKVKQPTLAPKNSSVNPPDSPSDMVMQSPPSKRKAEDEYSDRRNYRRSSPRAGGSSALVSYPRSPSDNRYTPGIRSPMERPRSETSLTKRSGYDSYRNSPRPPRPYHQHSSGTTPMIQDMSLSRSRNKTRSYHPSPRNGGSDYERTRRDPSGSWESSNLPRNASCDSSQDSHRRTNVTGKDGWASYSSGRGNNDTTAPSIGSPSSHRRTVASPHTPSPQEANVTPGEEVDLPPNWRTAKAPNGRTYYYHTVTGQTQWNAPAVDVTQDGVSRAQLDEVIRNAALQRQKLGQQQRTAEERERTLDTPSSNSSQGEFRKSNQSNKVSGTSTSETRRISTSGTAAGDQENAVKEAVARVVTKYLSKYKADFDKEQFKKEARKITRIVLEKERRSSSFTSDKLLDMSMSKRAKIKIFVDEYAQKLLTKQTKP
ncbi:hypothetical protein IWQ62_004864 [Dispira parvispora]|uniref:[histone H3]-lysine(36) N-trimethyltransferase n=1 Tax=Dispira parvispora TaxID=1520584 RepID=A0A9W8AL32_9FUNG|nr:hypothetical protein IWQ62_004864 [Dispira parvispora]